MNPPFAKGSKVKLTDRYAKVLSRAKGNPIWIGRIGVVSSCTEVFVTIMWEGRKSPDYVLVKGVELVP
jgi:hypothetical protein